MMITKETQPENQKKAEDKSYEPYADEGSTEELFEQCDGTFKTPSSPPRVYRRVLNKDKNKNKRSPVVPSPHIVFKDELWHSDDEMNQISVKDYNTMAAEARRKRVEARFAERPIVAVGFAPRHHHEVINADMFKAIDPKLILGTILVERLEIATPSILGDALERPLPKKLKLIENPHMTNVKIEKCHPSNLARYLTSVTSDRSNGGVHFSVKEYVTGQNIPVKSSLLYDQEMKGSRSSEFRDSPSLLNSNKLLVVEDALSRLKSQVLVDRDNEEAKESPLYSAKESIVSSRQLGHTMNIACAQHFDQDTSYWEQINATKNNGHVQTSVEVNSHT